MKKNTIEVAGKTLCFGLAGFFDHIEDASGKDALEWMNEMFDRFKKGDDGKWHLMSIHKEVTIYAYAGINLQNDLEDKETMSLDRVKRWVRTLSHEDYGKIIDAAVESMIDEKSNGEAKGELVAQPVS